MPELSSSHSSTRQPCCSLQQCEARVQFRHCSSEMIWRLNRAVLGVPTPGLCFRKWRNSEQNFYNKYHTTSSSLHDIQWFLKGTKKTSKPKKCTEVIEQTTGKYLARTVCLCSAQISLRSGLGLCNISKYHHYGREKKEVLVREFQLRVADCEGEKEAEKLWCQQDNFLS